MRSYCAVYIDAGYLLAAAATRVTGTSFRGGVTITYRPLIEAIVAQVEAESGLPLLRIHWYDSATGSGGGPDATQDAIGMIPQLKLRLGRMSPGGEQKGVDLRIGLDLATHGRNHVADVMYLVSGDDDLTEAVEEAQGHGSQVILLAAPDRLGQAHAVSRNLQRAADGILVIDPLTIDKTVKARKRPMPVLVPEDEGGAAAAVAAPVSVAVAVANAAVATPPAVPTPASLAGKRPLPAPSAPSTQTLQPAATVVYSSTTGSAPINHLAGDTAADGGSDLGLGTEVLEAIDAVAHRVVDTWKATVTDADLRQVRAERPYIPQDLDRTLLLDLSSRLGIYTIDERTRHVLRERFWHVLTGKPDSD